VSEILFITGDGLFFGRGKYADVIQVVNARAGDFGPNVEFNILLNGVYSQGVMCNILSRAPASAYLEDPWISLAATHDPNLIIFGEDGWTGPRNPDLKNNNDGINVYVRG
jgi:hypothetical protein